MSGLKRFATALGYTLVVTCVLVVVLCGMLGIFMLCSALLGHTLGPIVGVSLMVFGVVFGCAWKVGE